jgi:hypothetical protein
MVNRSLQNALKAQSRCDFLLRLLSKQGRSFFNVVTQFLTQPRQISATRAQYLNNSGNIGDCQQQVLNSQKLVPAVTSLLEGFVQTIFKFAT